MRTSLTLTALACAAVLTAPTTIAQPSLEAAKETVSFEIDLDLPENQLYASVQEQARTHCKSDSGSMIFNSTIRRKCRMELTEQIMTQIGALDYATLESAAEVEPRTDS